jgi:hypothetical protein
MLEGYDTCTRGRVGDKTILKKQGTVQITMQHHTWSQRGPKSAACSEAWARRSLYWDVISPEQGKFGKEVLMGLGLG